MLTWSELLDIELRNSGNADVEKLLREFKEQTSYLKALREKLEAKEWELARVQGELDASEIVLQATTEDSRNTEVAGRISEMTLQSVRVELSACKLKLGDALEADADYRKVVAAFLGRRDAETAAAIRALTSPRPPSTAAK